MSKCAREWRESRLESHLQRTKQRVVSAYMDDHNITSLLRTFEIMSRHENKCGSPVVISWQCGAGGYLGIVSNKGDVELNQQFPIGGHFKPGYDSICIYMYIHSNLSSNSICGYNTTIHVTFMQGW